MHGGRCSARSEPHRCELGTPQKPGCVHASDARPGAKEVHLSGNGRIRMTSKLLVSALAAVAAIVVVAAPQDPSFDYPAAKHVGFDQPKDEPVLAPLEQQDKSDRVSVSFTNATVREVLDWLKNQGMNF